MGEKEEADQQQKRERGGLAEPQAPERELAILPLLLNSLLSPQPPVFFGGRRAQASACPRMHAHLPPYLFDGLVKIGGDRVVEGLGIGVRHQEPRTAACMTGKEKELGRDDYESNNNKNATPTIRVPPRGRTRAYEMHTRIRSSVGPHARTCARGCVIACGCGGW